jgi:quercetin dioxygenase-like cupin family protein
MKRPTFLLATLVTLLAFSGSAGLATSQELPPGPTTVGRLGYAVTDQPASFETIQMILDFAPGSWTPPHTHGGETFVTVLEGEVTVRQHGSETTYRAGEGWRELPGAVHAAGNMTHEKARVFVTFLLPEGAQLTTVVSAAESPVQVASGDPWWAEAETLGCAASASVCCDRPMIGGPAVC